MNVSLKWLTERVDLGDRTVDEISNLLTFAGIEVEQIHQVGVASEKIVVAEIVAAEKHPNADKLKVCKVDAGEAALRQIVCGAQNYQVGDKVPCALPGAELPAGFTIGATKMRGVASDGMLCAAREIGLGKGSDGLMILDEQFQPGTPLRDLFDHDTLFEIEVTPNRPDLLSHTGLARELSALFRSPLKRVEFPVAKTAPAAPSQIVLEETDGCPFYSLVKITGVKVGPSPDWLTEKLTSIGLKPINNVVDITNYVLHELGQPLHAFDAARVSGAIHVRPAKPGERFVALDEMPYDLIADDCVISDESGAPLALGGVMGGLDSGISDSTTTILLEGAWFRPQKIRRTSRRLGLMSDSSYRFERGVDPQTVLPASAFAASLICDVAGGQIAGNTSVTGKIPQVTGKVALDRDRLNHLMDDSISDNEADDILMRLGLEKSPGDIWTIPTWRADLHRSTDLIEEIARVHGLENVPVRVGGHVVDATKTDTIYDQMMVVKRHLAAIGFYEARTIKLISESQLTDALPLRPLQAGDIVAVARPLSEDHAVLRPSLVPGLVATAERNLRFGVRSLRFFEIGRHFRNSGGGKATDLEGDSLALLLGGDAHAASWSKDGDRSLDLFDLKGVIQSLVPNHGVQFSPRPRDGFLLAGDISIDGKPMGVYAQLAPSRCRSIDLDAPGIVAEIDARKLLPLTAVRRHAEPLPQFPGSTRDIAMELPIDLSNAEIERAISKHREPLLVSAHCFDLFRDPSGDKIAADRKSIAWSFSYRAADRTLKSKEIDDAHAKVREHLGQALPVTFR